MLAPDALTVDVEVFRRAPVVEAILRFDFAPLDNLSDTIPALEKDLRESGLSDHEAEVDRSEMPGGKQGEAYIFRSGGGRDLIRLGRTRFSFHRLPPYTQWSDLADGAQRAWDLVRRRYEPETVYRIGLRYLNQIVFPDLQGRGLKHYLNLFPHVPARIDTGMSNHLMRLSLRDDRVPGKAEVTQLINPTDPHATWGLTFDIDVSWSGDYGPNSPLLWDQVNRLRDYKNRLFFESITEECRELFR